MTLLTVTDLQVSISGEQILKDINFTVDAGRVLGIVGESGSGKSMTAYSVMRLLPRGSEMTGSITLGSASAGISLSNLSESKMCTVRGKDIGMVFQEPMTALNPLQSIGDQISETVRIHSNVSRSTARKITLETLTKVELPPSEFPLSRFPHELSGGQRQRVVIAMAIALRPRLLIADEPTTALDVTTQAQLLSLLRRFVDEDGMGLILISHDLAVVANAADDIVVMREGQILDSGATDQVFGRQRHPYTTQLLKASTHTPIKRINSEHDALIHRKEATPLLQVVNLIRDYPMQRASLFREPKYFRAVDDVSFTLHRGENLGLVGESGCGKSTLTRAILGLEAIQGGSVLLDGVPVSYGISSGKGDDSVQRKAQYRKMQVVMQDPYGSFNPRHTVARLVAEPLYVLSGKPAKKERQLLVVEVLERVGLSAADGSKYIHEFSGGQRQRIAIARALINRPSLIILDEAVSALDVSIRAQILDLLAELSSSFDIAYLFISHDLSVVRSVTDRVLVMKDGRIVERGETDVVFDTPQHPYTKDLIAALPKLAYSG